MKTGSIDSRDDLTIDPPPIFSTPLYNNKEENNLKIPKKRLYPAEKTSSTFIKSPISSEIKETPPMLLPPSHYQVLANCIDTHDSLVKIGRDIFQDKIKSKQAHLIETVQKHYEQQREANDLKQKNKTLQTASNILSIVGGVVSICIAGALFSAGAIIPAVGLFFAAAASTSGAIFELAGISNKVTTSLQVTGGILALFASGVGAVTGALRIPFVLQVGASVLKVAQHTAGGISSIYQKQSLEAEAFCSILDGQIDIDRMDIEEGVKIFTHAAESYELNTLNLVAALKNEIEIYKKLVSIQQSGRN